MLQVSDAAITLLKTALDAETEPDAVFRLIHRDDSFALMKVPSAEAGDVIYEQAGTAVLAAPQDVAEGLDSRVIDVEETNEGPRLVVLQQ